MDNTKTIKLLENRLSEPATEKENKLMLLIGSLYSYIFALYREALNNTLNDIVGVSKREGENKGQWGYIGCYDGSIYTIIRRLNIKSLIDLGSGSGILLSILRRISEFDNHNLNLKGFEIEKKLVRHARDFNVPILQRDILKIYQNDIKGFDALYFYEPLATPELSKQFVDNLNNILIKGQFIIYAQAGTIGNELDKSLRFKQLKRNSYLKVYLVIN